MMAIVKPRCLLPGAVLRIFNNSERMQHCCILGRQWTRVNTFGDDGMRGIAPRVPLRRAGKSTAQSCRWACSLGGVGRVNLRVPACGPAGAAFPSGG
jgi:hypothetical protein